jgi:hypothetical protein
MPVRSTIEHHPVYQYLHRKTFGADEDPPTIEIYLPDLLKTTEMSHRIMRPIWQAEVDTIWTHIAHDMAARGIQGDLLEFGVSSGGSFRRLIDIFSDLNVIKKFWGFDSFEGLPEPVPGKDHPTWKRGDYKAARDAAWAHITQGLERTDNMELVEGLFCDSLPRVAHLIDRVAFIRFDCDLWASTNDALNFLQGRLVDGAIFYFDDWTFDVSTGETRAFFEFAERTSGMYRFEKLFVVSQGAFSLRVRVK